MSYAPATLLQARAYLKRHTGLGDNALGIVGDAAHTYGYHLGKDRLPANDYSARTNRDRAGLTNAASALDIGNFSRLRALTAHLAREARAGRARDVREIIGPGSDGRAYRWDVTDGWTARQRSKGDSHEWHTHLSFFRDSEHRSKLDLFESFFEPTKEDDMQLGDRVNLWDEKGNKPWRAGKSIGVTKESPNVTVGQLLMWGGEVGHLMHRHVLPGISAQQKLLEQLVANQSGLTVEQVHAATAAGVREVLDPDALAEGLADRLEGRLDQLEGRVDRVFLAAALRDLLGLPEA